MREQTAESADMWSIIRDQLESCGVDLEALGCFGQDGTSMKMKVVCIADDLRSSLDALGKSARDQVLMVRVDKDTVEELDAWVETGAMKSRSAAAAFFIREGLQVRSSEFGELKSAVDAVAEAKARLRNAARDVFGGTQS